MQTKCKRLLFQDHVLRNRDNLAYKCFGAIFGLREEIFTARNKRISSEKSSVNSNETWVREKKTDYNMLSL